MDNCQIINLEENKSLIIESKYKTYKVKLEESEELLREKIDVTDKYQNSSLNINSFIKNVNDYIELHQHNTPIILNSSGNISYKCEFHYSSKDIELKKEW